MKQAIIYTLFTACSLFSFCQSKDLPRIENDTLYTVSGFKLYAGLVLAAGPFMSHYSANHGYGEQFKTVKGIAFPESPKDPKYRVDSITIVKLEKLYVSKLNNVYVGVKARIHHADGSSDKGNLRINFEEAIRPKNGGSPELIIP